MSDASVRAALRSDARIVAVESPAGCGKTHQGADYARELTGLAGTGRVLVLTHTHAACSVFSRHTKGTGSRVEIRTIDSIVASVASAYHAGLGLPGDTTTWVRQRKDGHAELAAKVAELLDRHPMIAAALARRYPVVLCDEHQDSSGDQHALVLALHAKGSRLRLFADPMQRIFKEKTSKGFAAPPDWEQLTKKAEAFEKLDVPHRWSDGCQELGHWTLRVREVLKAGGKIDLTAGVPSSVQILVAENRARRNLECQLEADCRSAVYRFQKSEASLLVLTRHNHTARSLRGFFNRHIELWEGHSRDGLDVLATTIDSAEGNAAVLADAVVDFMNEIGAGFSPSAFGRILREEAQEGCSKKRSGRPAKIQSLARLLVEAPNHRGVANTLRRIAELIKTDPDFAAIKVDCRREFYDGLRLGDFDSIAEAVLELTNRRVYARPQPTARAISTIHKAKGLQCDAVALMPCDATTFPDKPDARCLLYVALTRARKRLLFVVSRDNPSPLLRL